MRLYICLDLLVWLRFVLRELNGKFHNRYQTEYYFEFGGEKPVYNVKMTLYCRIVSANANAPVSELYPSAKVSDEILEATEKKIKATITSLYKKSQLVGCDLFGIKDELYKYHYKKYEGLKDDVLSATALNLEITCRSNTTTRHWY